MKRSATVIALLVLGLLASNAWWAYQLIDTGVTLSYREQELENYSRGLHQALDVIRSYTRNESSRQSIVAAASKASYDNEPFEKDGYLWVGTLGLQFNEKDRLSNIVFFTEPQ